MKLLLTLIAGVHARAYLPGVCVQSQKVVKGCVSVPGENKLTML